LPDFEKYLPLPFIERLNVLTRLLNEGYSGTYSDSELDARLEFVRKSLGNVAEITNEYVIGWFSELNAIGRATLLAECGLPNWYLDGTGNEMPPPIPGPTPADLEAGADMLSQLAFVNGRLELAKFREIPPARELRYAHIIKPVTVNGKKRFLTIIKIKEISKKIVYVAQIVDNKHELIPNWGAACFPSYG
jgi:hypothetical protein